jgi:hypothetical protein
MQGHSRDDSAETLFDCYRRFRNSQEVSFLLLFRTPWLRDCLCLTNCLLFERSGAVHS